MRMCQSEHTPAIAIKKNGFKAAENHLPLIFYNANGDKNLPYIFKANLKNQFDRENYSRLRLLRFENNGQIQQNLSQPDLW